MKQRVDFREWYLSLTDQEREAYATRAGTKPGYIRVHLIGRRKIPRPALMERLATASLGRYTVADLAAFFYQPSPQQHSSGDSPSQQAAA